MAMTAAGLIRAWFEQVWNEGRTDLIESYLAADGIVHGLDETGTTVRGPEGFRPFYDKMRAAFSDIHFDLHEVLESGNVAAGRWTGTLTHTGDGMGLAATNRCITFTGMSMAREEGGQIVEGWNEWDRATLLLSIGAIVAVEQQA